MLPKNRLGRQMATKLKVYRGADHPHAAQAPVPMEIPGARRTASARSGAVSRPPDHPTTARTKEPP